MLDFYNIREIACQHFYKWEQGEDFVWLKNEWHKFEPHLKTKNEVENFILVLSDIYEHFCSESYFAKISDEDVKKYDWIIENPNLEPENPELTKIIEQFFDRTLDILLEVYKNPDEILRQFISIAIGFEVPHPDGYEYILNLFKDKYNEIEDNFELKI